jgi:hypothetical protein
VVLGCICLHCRSRFDGVYGVVIRSNGNRGSDTSELSKNTKNQLYTENINKREKVEERESLQSIA